MQAQEQLSPAQVQALREQLAQLQASEAALKAQLKSQPRGLTLKVSEKGALSVYGMGRFPVTLYVEQWERLAAKMPDIQAFIAANRPALKTKDAAE